MRVIAHDMKKRTKHGFSVVEILIYLSVTVLVAGALVTTFLSLTTTLLRNKTEQELAHSASVSLERMVRDIREAHSVDTGMSVLGTSPGVLELESASGTTRFYVTGDDLVVSVDGAVVGPLTSDVVTVQNVVFNLYTGSTTNMVRIALTLSAVSRAASSTRTFYTSAVLRGSYE
jgi:Tfp pilus assembly protein PilW